MNGSVAQTLDNLEQRWQGSDPEVLRGAFALLATGRPWTAAEVAARLGLSPRRVGDALEFPKLGRGPRGELVELFGFTLTPTWHRVDIGSRAMFACCALVAHTVPHVLGSEVRIVSVDPVGRGVIEIRADPGGVRSSGPSGAQATFPLSAGPWHSASVADDFCSHARHFASSRSAREFATADSRRSVIAIEELHQLARQAGQRIFSL